jgi:parallel beta-helix repeat protein
VTLNQGNGVEITSSGSSYNKIIGNTITSNGANKGNAGIMIAYDNNLVEGNTIAGNQWGIEFDASQRCTVHQNWIGNNVYGAINFVSRPYKGVAFHVIFENYFIGNDNCSFGYMTNENTWDNNSRGNYWSNYNGTDLDNDGIGDSPYFIASSNADNYPLMTQTSINVNLTEFLPSPTPPPTPSPSPRPSLTASPSPSPNPTPTPTVPEFPLWTISLMLGLIVATAGLLVYQKKHKTT